VSETRSIDFLIAMGQALSALRLYASGHPARSQALEKVHRALVATLDETPGGTACFTFLGDDVVVGERRLRELDRWTWGRQLAEAGIERLEATPGVTAGEVVRFLDEAVRRLDAAPGREGVEPTEATATAERSSGAFHLEHLRFGRVAEVGDETWNIGIPAALERMGQMFEAARVEGAVEASVAAAVVEAVGAAVAQSRNLLRLLVPLKEVDQYSTIHSMNVSVLSVGLAEQVGYGHEDARSVGKAALLHDVGKSLVPEEILNKPGTLTPEEWTIIKRHPIDGARILFRSRDGLGVAAVVAYEHHMTWSGGGYPERRFARDVHPATQLVQICDVYDALRTRRPFRGPWSEDRIQAHLRAGAGEAFSPEVVDLFLQMMEGLEDEATAT
jgi:putative nucleotidyltransferase with HDIG domain